MSEARRSGERDLLYSEWHRTASTQRFLGKRQASELGMIDIDDVDYCRRCTVPLAIIETQRSGGAPKPASVMASLARRANLPAFSVSYFACDAKVSMSEYTNEDILRFVGHRLEPLSDIGPVHMSPESYAQWLYSLRVGHWESGECRR